MTSGGIFNVHVLQKKITINLPAVKLATHVLSAS